MRYVFVLILFLAFSVNMAFAQVQKQHPPPVIVPSDSLTGSSKLYSADIAPEPLAEIPVLTPPPEAKILTWWPDDGCKYFMPNVLVPQSIPKAIKRWYWKKQEREDRLSRVPR